jgi:NADP-dependent 3-hydroxy acid dehydrogenase YdfG
VRWSWSPTPPTGSAGQAGRVFAEREARVVLAAPRADALEDLAGQCQAAGGQALAVPTDMTDKAASADEVCAGPGQGRPVAACCRST